MYTRLADNNSADTDGMMMLLLLLILLLLLLLLFLVLCRIDTYSYTSMVYVHIDGTVYRRDAIYLTSGDIIQPIQP